MARTSLDFIELDSLNAYLNAANWDRVVSNDRRTIWEHRRTGNRIFAPEQLGPDFAELMQLAIQQIAVTEHREEDDIVIDLAWRRFDKLHLRREARGSALPLADALDLQEALRDLILAGARASQEHRRTFRGRHPTAVEQYMDQVRVIPSSPGSFVMRVLLPLAEPPEQEPLPLAGPASPSVRKVATTILRATSTAVETALDVGRGGELQRWEDAVGQGVSSNLCDALARLPSSNAPKLGDAELRIDWTWAAPDDTTSPIVVPTGLAPILAAGSDYLRGEPEEHTIWLTGLVIKLHRETASGPGEITIRGYVEGLDSGTRTVRLDLDERTYREAIQAHDRGISVRVGALVRREARGLNIVRVEDMQLLEPTR